MGGCDLAAAADIESNLNSHLGARTDARMGTRARSKGHRESGKRCTLGLHWDVRQGPCHQRCKQENSRRPTLDHKSRNRVRPHKSRHRVRQLTGGVHPRCFRVKSVHVCGCAPGCSRQDLYIVNQKVSVEALLGFNVALLVDCIGDGGYGPRCKDGDARGLRVADADDRSVAGGSLQKRVTQKHTVRFAGAVGGGSAHSLTHTDTYRHRHAYTHTYARTETHTYTDTHTHTHACVHRQ